MIIDGFDTPLQRCAQGYSTISIILLTVFHHSELFFVARIFFRAVFGAAGFEAFDQFVGILDLGFVLEDGLHFDIPHLRDIHWLCWAAW